MHIQYFFRIFLVFVAAFTPHLLIAQEDEGSQPEAEVFEEGGIDYQEYYESLKRKYDELVDSSSKKSDEAFDWVRRDIKNMFSWEYKILTLPADDEERMLKELNELGIDRWQLVQVVPRGDRLQLFLKRPPKSYFKSLPLKELLRLLPSGGGGE